MNDEPTLSLELTTHCQQNCHHCFARSSGKEFTHMDGEIVEEILKEGRLLGFSRLHLTGGEVFLYPDIEWVLKRARDLGYESFFINTNGHLLNADLCEFLSDFKGLQLSISLNGNREHHDNVRGSGAYDRAMSGLKRALATGLKVFVFTVVQRDNLQDLPLFCYNLYHEYPGIQGITWIQLRGGTEAEGEKLAPEDFVSMVRSASLLRLGGIPISILDNPLSTAVAQRMGIQHLPPSLPISREGRLLVFADYRIAENHSSRADFGTYREGALMAGAESEDYLEVIAPDEESCSPCPYYSVCRRSGVLKPSDEDHNIPPYDSPFCRKVMDLL